MLEANALQCDEATLTGESVPVNKRTSPIEEDAPPQLQGHRGMTLAQYSRRSPLAGDVTRQDAFRTPTCRPQAGTYG